MIGHTAEERSACRIKALKLVLALRAQTVRLLEPDLCTDPALDMLLELLRQTKALEGVSLERGSGRQGGGELHRRWLKLLERRGWIEQVYDPQQPCRLSPRLSIAGERKLDDYLDHITVLMQQYQG